MSGTCEPAQRRRAALSATVCGPDLAFADAFATGLLAAGEAGFEAVTLAGYEALIMLPGGGGVSTPEFPIFKGALK